MELYTNEHGKQVWRGATMETPFSADLFHDVDMSWNDSGDRQRAMHTNLGSLTVLDRQTGFGWRDTETGFRDMDGNFWLASGMQDVTCSQCKTIGEAIEWVKNNANTCNPDVTDG